MHQAEWTASFKREAKLRTERHLSSGVATEGLKKAVLEATSAMGGQRCGKRPYGLGEWEKRPGTSTVPSFRAGYKSDYFTCTTRKEALEYHWKPAGCELVPYRSHDQICAALGGRDLLFVGDSKSANFHDEFQLYWLQEGAINPDNQKSLEVCKEFYEGVQMKAPTLRWVLSRHIDRVEGGGGHGDWKVWVSHRNANDLLPVVIIGTGQWFRKNVDGMYRALADTVLYFDDLFQQTPQIKQPVFYKSNNVPIPNCLGQNSPLQTPFDPIAGTPDGDPGIQYGFRQFPLYEAFASHYFPQAGVAYLDIWNISSYRPDTLTGSEGKNPKAIDCSHHCIPGLHSSFNQLLVNMLLGWIDVGAESLPS